MYVFFGLFVFKEFYIIFVVVVNVYHVITQNERQKSRQCFFVQQKKKKTKQDKIIILQIWKDTESQSWWTTRIQESRIFFSFDSVQKIKQIKQQLDDNYVLFVMFFSRLFNIIRKLMIFSMFVMIIIIRLTERNVSMFRNNERKNNADARG